MLRMFVLMFGVGGNLFDVVRFYKSDPAMERRLVK